MAIEIDKIDEEMQNICAVDANGSQLADAVANRCEYGSLPQELRPVFSSAQEVFSIVNRILSQEQTILQRFEHLRDELQEKIKASQNTPKIEKYLSGLAEQPQGEASYLGMKYGKV